MEIEERKLKLSKHLEDVKKSINEIERNFQKEREELNEKLQKAEKNKKDAITPLHKAAYNGNIRLILSINTKESRLIHNILFL